MTDISEEVDILITQTEYDQVRRRIKSSRKIFCTLNVFGIVIIILIIFLKCKTSEELKNHKDFHKPFVNFSEEEENEIIIWSKKLSISDVKDYKKFHD